MNKWIKDNKIIFLIAFAVSALIPLFITTYEVIYSGKESVAFTFNSPIDVLVIVYYVLLFFIGIAFFLFWLTKQIKAIMQLKKDKKNAELSHLKAQVSPHFFFNMLNSLYGWVDKDPQIAKDLILKLSDMMRYSIYEGQKDKVDLKKELFFFKKLC